MNNPFKYSSDNKRYHTLAYHNKSLGIKSQKAVIDAGLSCPNIDGKVSFGGCIFCDGSGGYFTDKSINIEEQLDKEIKRIHLKNPDALITAYFQSNTNTYCSCEKLKSMLSICLKDERVSFISLGTRPDCIDEKNIKILSEANKIKPLTLELGLQTANDNTAAVINRGYNYSCFTEAVKRIKREKIRLTVHLICGLPGETIDDMKNTAKEIAKIKPEAVKIHLLHIIKGTKLHKMYESGEYSPMEFEEYLNAAISMLELLPSETVIERITGDGDKSKLIAPLWSRDKIKVLGSIDKLMAERETFQARLYLQD